MARLEKAPGFCAAERGQDMTATWFLLAWTTWACPGGMLSRFIPEPAKPVICQPDATRSLMFVSKEDALSKVQDLGPYAVPVLHWCQTGKCWTRKIEWKTMPEIK